MKITRGKIAKAQKIVIYGPEGIGKTTFASQFPNPIFIDTEGSTTHLDVARLPAPTSWTQLFMELNHVKINPNICKTLILDTADWAEILCIRDFCAKKQLTGIEDIGYGKGYVYIADEFGKMLNLLSDIVEQGINVVITAHAIMRKFEQPDELGAYDRWELKLQKKVAPLVKEWADMVLFANYKTFAVATDKEGKKHKAQGGQRVMYTNHHPCWDAKNRHGLSNELPFEYKAIAHCITNVSAPQQSVPVQQQSAPVQESKPLDMTENVGSGPMDYGVNEQKQEQVQEVDIYQGLPKDLVDLMKPKNVTPEEIQNVVGMKGYYPSNTPIQNYEPSFIQGVLVGAWNQVFEMIESERILPF